MDIRQGHIERPPQSSPIFKKISYNSKEKVEFRIRVQKGL